MTQVKSEIIPSPKQGQCRTRDNNHGFTLIELVLVAALLAFLSTILYGTLRGILQAKEATDHYRDIEQTAHSVLGRLTLELSGRGLVPLSKREDDSLIDEASAVGSPYIVGVEGKNGEFKSDRLRFVANNSGQRFIDAAVNYGVVEVEYRLEDDPNDKSLEFGSDEKNDKLLVREEVPALVATDEIRKARRVVVPIAEKVVSLGFRYLRRGDWQNTWREIVPPFPEAIEITLGLRGTDDTVQIFRTAIALSQRQKQFGQQ